jgi:hypothetical protein
MPAIRRLNQRPAGLPHLTERNSEVVAAYAVAWLLLLSGVRHALGDGIRASDAHALRDKTHLPHGLAGRAGRRPAYDRQP